MYIYIYREREITYVIYVYIYTYVCVYIGPFAQAVALRRGGGDCSPTPDANTT